MDGAAIFYSTTCIMLLKMYGVEIGNAEIFTLALAIFTISVGTPGIPGGGIVLAAAILGMFGVPAEAVSIVMGIIPIENMFGCATNITSDICLSTVVAKSENLLDESIYNKM